MNNDVLGLISDNDDDDDNNVNQGGKMWLEKFESSINDIEKIAGERWVNDNNKVSTICDKYLSLTEQLKTMKESKNEAENDLIESQIITLDDLLQHYVTNFQFMLACFVVFMFLIEFELSFSILCFGVPNFFVIVYFSFFEFFIF